MGNRDIISPKSDWCFKELFEISKVREDFLAEVLGIPREEIADSIIVNSFLWKRRQDEKQGILDVRVRLRDGSRINIEVQLRRQDDWDKRTLYYLGKMYTEDLRFGTQKYRHLKRCIQIQILDFNLIGNEQAHNVFLLRNKDGVVYTDEIQIHVLELKKKSGTEGIMEWIQFLNLKKEKEAVMLLGMTKKEGILLAIEQLLAMSGSKKRQAVYEDHLKYVRDRDAELSYAIRTGKTAGREEGREEGIRALVSFAQKSGLGRAEAAAGLIEHYPLTEKEAEDYVERYWK